MALTLAIEDAPDIFMRASLWNFILPMIAVIVIQVRKISNYFIRHLPTGLLVLLVLIVSLSNTIIALANTIHSFAIPEGLVTPGWEYTQNTSIVVLIIFSAALILNIALVIRTYKEERHQ